MKTAYTTIKAAKKFNIRRGRPLAAPRSRNGTKATIIPRKPKNRIPSTFPFDPGVGLAGQEGRQVLQGLEHKEEIPLRLDVQRRRAEGIGLLAEFPGEKGRQGRKHSQGHVPADHIPQEEVRNKRHAGGLLRAAVLLDHVFRHTDLVLLHQIQVQPHDAQGRQRQDDHVQGIEAGQRIARYVLAAPRHQQEVFADHGNRARDRRAYAGSEKGQSIPGQKVSAEAERHEYAQQCHPRQPSELTRRPIGPHDIGGQNMQVQHADQQVGAPGMDRSDEPAEIDLRDDRPHTLEGLVGRGLVIQRQQDPRDDLDAEEEQRHPAQKVEERAAVDRHALVGRQRGGGVQAQPVEEEGHDGADQTMLLAVFRQGLVRVRNCQAGDCQALRETMISSCPGCPLPFSAW